MKSASRIAAGLLTLLGMLALVSSFSLAYAFADESQSGYAALMLSEANKGQSQTVKSKWTEVLELDNDNHAYGWQIRAAVTITDGVVSDVVCSAKGDGGGDIPPNHRKYYNTPIHDKMEMKLIDAKLSAENPSMVDDVDVVTGATHTCTTIKNVVKAALERWNDNMASVQPVVELLQAIPAADEQETAISKARKAYNALSEDLKTYVPAKDLKLLTDAEKAAADKKAADALKDVIGKLPAASSITLNDKASVESARSAYESLSADQKAQVDTKALEAAEAKIAQLEEAAAKAAAEEARKAEEAKAAEEARKAAEAKAAEEARKAEANIANGSVSLAKSKYTYTGKAFKPSVTVKTKAGKKLANGKDFSVSYTANKKVGTATVTVKGTGSYNGQLKATFKIVKAAQPMTVKAKAPQVKAGKSLKQSKVFTVKNAKGAVTYKKAKGNSKISVASNGKISVKKGLKANSYTIKVKVTAKGDANYKSGSKTVTVKVKVKVK